jgi:integrase/recombinase XerC
MRQDDEIILTRFEEALTLSELSASTIVNYLADVRAFLRWGKVEIGDSFALAHTTQEHIRRYRNYLTQELKRAASTVNRHLMALRKFSAFAAQIGVMSLDPTSGVSLVQDNRQVASRILSGEETEKLLQAAEKGSRAGLVRRDVAILQLLLHAGLRISEIVDLEQADVLLDNPGVRLRVGRVEQNEDSVRYLPLPKPAYKALTDYLLVRPHCTVSNHLFLGQDGRPISSRTVQRIVSNCAKSAGIAGISAQSLRRTFAVQLLANSHDMDLVSERLGHQHRATTEQYLAVHKNSSGLAGEN